MMQKRTMLLALLLPMLSAAASVQESPRVIRSAAGLPARMGATVAVSATGEQAYALTETAGVFRLNRATSVWEIASRGLPVPFHHRTEGSLIAVHPSNADRVFALLRVPVNSHREETQLFASSDGGNNWSLIKELGAATFLNMTVDSGGSLTLTAHDTTSVRIDPIEDLPASPVASTVPPPIALPGDMDFNNTAVIEDDGSIVGREFDLSNRSIEFRPVLDSYSLAPIATTYDEDVGNPIQLTDEDSRFVALPFTFPFYGVNRNSVFINSNGFLTFLQRDLDFSPSIDEFVVRAPRIAPLWTDLDPATGTVYLKAIADRVVVSWVRIPMYFQTAPNTFQVVLFRNGTIQFNYKDLAAKTGITGIGNGYQRTTQSVIYSSLASSKTFDALPILQRFRTPDIDIARLTQRFYQTHDDDFDALVVFGSGQYQTNVASGAGAYFAGVKNDVMGLGISVTDLTSVVGSAGRLQGLINMNRLSQYPDDIIQPIPDSTDSAITILGQEWGHRFGAFVRFRDDTGASTALLGRSGSHWSYFLNTEASVLEGNEWRDNGDGTFTATDVVRRYSKLDQYLMGLRSSSEVPPIMLISNPQPVFKGSIGSFVSTMGLIDNGIRDTSKNFGAIDQLKGFLLRLAFLQSPSSFSSVYITASGRNDSGSAPDHVSSSVNNLRSLASSGNGVPYEITHLASSAPQAKYYDPSTRTFTGDNITIQGTRKNVRIEDIIDWEGERIPAKGAAPTAFRHAFILVIPTGTQATASDLGRIDAGRRGWESFYRQATDGLASVSTTLGPGVSRISRSVNARGMTTITSEGVSNTATVAYGALDVGADQVGAVAFLTGRSGSRIVSDTAVPALGTIRRASLYAERTTSVNTGIAVASPAGAVTMNLQLRNSDGSLAAETTLDMASRGQVSRFLNELFPSFAFPAAFRGSIGITASGPIVITTLRTAINETGEFLMTTIPVSDANDVPSTAAYLAHFADGAGYFTDAILINRDATSVSGNLEWRSTTGALIGTSVRYTLPAYGVQLISSGTGSGTLRTGYVAVRADSGQFAPAFRSIIQLRDTSRLVSLTGIYPSQPVRRSQTFVDMRDTHDSGLALLNDGGTAATIQLTVVGRSGTPVTSTATVNLPARNQTASFVSELFPSLPRGFAGTIEISSDVPIQVMALRSTATPDRVLLAALPVESLELRRNDAVLYLPQLVDGGGFSSEIFLMNLGSATSLPRLSFISPTGVSTKIPIISVDNN